LNLPSAFCDDPDARLHAEARDARDVVARLTPTTPAEALVIAQTLASELAHVNSDE
jgi:hypothetical protein